MAKGDGFTIIEVTIFLAISGLLITMAIFGAGSMARFSRYSDSVNSFQSYLQQQYENVQNGVNTRAVNSSCVTSTNPGTSTCLLMGRVISFNTGTNFSGVARYVRASGAMNISDTTSIYNQISQVTPQVLTDSEETFDMAWGASLQEASRASDKVLSDPVKLGSSPARALINSVAFLRGPNSSQIVPYYFYAAVATPATLPTAAAVQAGLIEAIKMTNVSKTTGQVTASLCIWNTKDWSSTTSPVAAVLFGDGRGSAGITTNYSPLRTGATQICSP